MHVVEFCQPSHSQAFGPAENDNIFEAAEYLSSLNVEDGPDDESSLLSRLADTIKNGNPNGAQLSALRYAGRGFYPIPVHGIVKNKQTKEHECACQSGKRWFAEKNRKQVEKCPSPGKHPSVQGWESHNASREPDTLMHLFDPKYNRRREGVSDGLNFGLVTGPDTGLVVLDIDGDEGRANLAKLEADHGPLPDTIRVVTGSGGLHIYWRSPDGVTTLNSASKIAPKVDFRGEHGFVVAPPSKHIKGGSYVWEKGCSPDDLELAEMPDWLVKLAVEGGEQEAATKPGKAKQASAKERPSGKAGRATSGSRRAGSGWRDYLAEVGDHEGGKGFDGPIWNAMLSYLRSHDADADADEFLEALGDTVEKADKSGKDNRDRYRPDSSYVAEQFEKARQTIRDTPERVWSSGLPIELDDDGTVLFAKHGRFFARLHEGSPWIWIKSADDDSAPCCRQFKVLSMAADAFGGSATITIGYETRHNGPRELTFDTRLLYERADLLKLLKGNFFPMFFESGVIDLFKLLDFPVDTLLVERTGWHEGAYLHPSGATVRALTERGNGTEKMRLRGGAPAGDWRGGTLEGWKAAVALAFDNDAHGREQFSLGVMAGCAGVLAGFVGMAGFPILNLHGNTSRGKSTALMLAASASAAAIERGAYQSLRKTDNGMESILSARSGITIAFDEGKTTNADALESTIWMMAHGAGKTRATVTGDARAGREFCGFAMTANEVPLAQMLAQARKTQPGGFHARVCDVDVSGVPELAGADKDRFFAAFAGIKQHYGHAWEPVVRHLQSVGVEHVASALDRLAKSLAGPDADSFTARSAMTLALVWYSGTIMQELGLIPACDLARIARWGWGTRAVESTLDPFTRGMETLLTNVATRRGFDILEWDNPEGRPFREAVAFVYMSGMEELLLVPRDKLADLCGGHMSVGMIRDQMAARGVLAMSGKKDPKPRWSKLPGEQPLSHYRIKLSELAKFAGD
ncbi:MULTISPECIES: bifunctional DNA primase/polymerase [unclassified Mesorhizobium]|uniref:bifunctional DNA primase/polymerase n=1 Tax=unclassified Mesorhizobium TaxID=325217 RepID=UPI000FCA7B84|nr:MULTISPECIES: bifunctional DNA primase/polymerase [unclassified Mesorhizobium]TGP27962.1 DUF927 domain-containing protein [Mesorhizobium sp. M2D.F.Ca.ET.232.01.1.1]TGQ25551.1 DUF927 domain-containing protein [Mesorhizobium sp. M00.F.Ca.ET.220.01.1.1]TGT97833.1 DUF927 domain-containing protein [bacterium M00.F.Ca.ET.163.01.1.1]